MREILTFFLLVALLAVAFKIALVLLFLAGLIFRTKETVGLLAILAIFAGFSAHPGIGVTLLVLIGGYAFYKNGTKPRDEPAAITEPDDDWSDEQE